MGSGAEALAKAEAAYADAAGVGDDYRAHALASVAVVRVRRKHYPEAMEAVIDESGCIVEAKIAKGMPMGLDRAAIEAVRSWVFEPATLDGNPVKVYYTLTVNFQIQ